MSLTARPGSHVPAHVPAELVWDHKFEAYLCELGDPYLAASRLHDGPDIVWVTNAANGKPAWIFTRHELIAEAFTDVSRFSSARGAILGAIMDPDWLMLPVEADPPDHRYYRQILVPFFTPGAIRDRAVEVQQLSDSLLAGFVDRGSCDFIREYAAILPNAIVLAILGLPQAMLGQFLEWENAVFHGTVPERQAAGRAILDHLKGFIAEQKHNPRTALMQGILAARINDRPLDDAEMLGIYYLLFVAGLDTVFSSLGWIMHHLATDPVLQARLRNNPQDIAAAVEEFTRAYGVSSPSRTVAQDMVFHGVTMKKGEDVRLPTYLAGRDPRAWPNPHLIDIDRKPRHVTFGAGAHVCLGVHLAKREMRIVIESFLSRMDNIHIPADGAFEYHVSSTLGVDRLDIAWRKL